MCLNVALYLHSSCIYFGSKYLNLNNFLHAHLDVDLQRKLLDFSLASCELDEDTLQQLADVIGDKWASIAQLLSLSTVEIEQIRSENCPARAMLQKLKEKGIVTHEQLCNCLQTISLLNPTPNLIAPKYLQCG